MAQFQNAGLGDAVASWLGQGPNKDVSGNDIQKALGSDILGALAQQANMAPSEASGILARILPAAIDQLTPKGQPQALDMANVQSMLGSFLKGRV